MKIRSKIRDYAVSFHRNFNFLPQILKEANKKLFIIDQHVSSLYRDVLRDRLPKKNLLVVDATEKNKVLSQALRIVDRMMQFQAKRNSVLVAIGGGIIQDISGFAASILYRGIKWIYIPTTLLAQADSCIGSKTSLNYGRFKNLLGTFYPPDSIMIDSGFLQTLTEANFQSGLGEIIKFYFIQGEQGIKEIDDLIHDLVLRDRSKIEKAIRFSLAFKRKFIERDEFDRGVRQILNYGHSFGHALESVSHYAIPHGQAVGLGMMIENHIAQNRGYLSARKVGKMDHLILRILFSISLRKKYFDIHRLIEAVKKDKKRTGKQLPAILMKGPHQMLRVQDVTPGEVKKAIGQIQKILRLT